MKLKNIFISLLAATALVACSDDESWNSGAATVEMGQPTVSVRENAGLFNVPITVTGEQNDYIRVTVEVAETGSTPAMEDVHYYVTSKSIVIPADATSGNIEISTVNDNDINDTRTFTVTIVSAEGATIGSQSSTTVELRDEDSDFYEKLKGNWTITGIKANDGTTPISWNGTITGVNEGEEGYGEILYLNGIGGADYGSATLLYHYDVATQTGSLEVLYGTLVASGLNFGDPVGVCDVYSGYVDADNYMQFEGSFTGTWNDEFTEITFDPSASLWGFLAPTGTTEMNGYLWFAIGNIVLTK